MLKTLMFGAAASLVGAGLFKANREGRLDPLKEKARDGLAHLREAAATRRAGKESAPGGRRAMAGGRTGSLSDRHRKGREGDGGLFAQALPPPRPIMRARCGPRGGRPDGIGPRALPATSHASRARAGRVDAARSMNI